MFHTFVIICAIFAVIMAVNLVTKAADIRKSVESIEDDLRSIKHSVTQQLTNATHDFAQLLASIEGVKAVAIDTANATDKVKESVDSLERSSSENVNRYIDFIRTLCPPEETPTAEPAATEPVTPEQETLLVEGSPQPALKEGEAVADIVEDPLPPAEE